MNESDTAKSVLSRVGVCRSVSLGCQTVLHTEESVCASDVSTIYTLSLWHYLVACLLFLKFP